MRSIDRLKTALSLSSGQIQQILLTGDGGAFRINEIKVTGAFDSRDPDRAVSTDERGSAPMKL